MNQHTQRLYQQMKKRLDKVVPDAELRLKAEIAAEILKLKKEKNALILAHNYMEPALFYSIPDYCGDSLDLSRRAAAAGKPIIVFCGVRFMAETAKILSPASKVLLPSPRAGCSLAESISADDLRALRRRYPDIPVITYVNTYADVKALSDVCCTSGNAAAVVESLHAPRVFLLPDAFLAANIAAETGRRIVYLDRDGRLPDHLPESPNGIIIGWHGKCEVHERFTTSDIENARRQFPDVAVLAHPECPPEVVAASDFSGGTNAMIRYVDSSPARRFLLLTECAMADNVLAAHPDREMIRICSLRCPHMNEITLEDTLEALRREQYEIQVPQPIADPARLALEKMIAIG